MTSALPPGAPLDADIGGVGVAAAIRSEIVLRLDEGPGIGHDIEDALIQSLGGDRFREEFCDAGTARHHDSGASPNGRSA